MRGIGEAVDTRKVRIRLCKRKATESGWGVRIDGTIRDDFVVANVPGVGEDDGVGLRKLVLYLQVEFEVSRILELVRPDCEGRRCIRGDGSASMFVVTSERSVWSRNEVAFTSTCFVSDPTDKVRSARVDVFTTTEILLLFAVANPACSAETV
jgi:hypothetical protein